VLVGRPPHVLRAATDADRARLAALRGGQVDLTSHPGTTVLTPPVAGVRTGQLYAYRDKTPPHRRHRGVVRLRGDHR
jgi:hypothetical protein